MMDHRAIWALVGLLAVGCSESDDSGGGGATSDVESDGSDGGADDADAGDDADNGAGDDGGAGSVDDGGGDDADDDADGGTGDGGGADDSSDPGGDGPTNSDACQGSTMRAKPNDTSVPGPWDVGARTFDLDGLTVEVWYPAPPGSADGQDGIVYDVRLALPDSEQALITDDINPPQPCDCHRDLPMDTDYGPYPLVVFIHGTAGWRTQSLRHMTHWASRGFVVMSADHPGLWMKDLLGGFCGAAGGSQNLAGDVNKMVAAARGQTPELGELTSFIDGTRFAVTGHSAGGSASAGFGGQATVVMPLAAGAAVNGSPALLIGGMADSIAAYNGVQNAFASSSSPKRLVGITNAGHLAFSEICALQNSTGANLVEIATEAGVCGTQFASFLFQCDAALTPDPDSWEIVEYATSAQLEEVMHCSDTVASNFDEIESRFSFVGEYQAG